MTIEGALRVLDGDDPSRRTAKLRAFEIAFVLVVGTEYWARAIPKWQELTEFYVVALVLATAACAAACTRRGRRLGFVVLAATQAAVVWREFPATGNHAYLELVLCTLAALLDPYRPADDGRLYLRAVRWIVCVVFFYGGLQKLVHGYYWRGQYLAYSLSTESFRGVLRVLLPADELARLASYGGQVGDGPYLLSSPLAVAASIAICAAEIALAPLLVWPRTRRLAIAAALAFLLAVEVAAREAFFGLVFANAILLFTWSDVHRRLVPFVALVLVLMIMVRLGILPPVVFY